MELKGPRIFGAPHIYRDAIIIPPLVYFAFCMINFQGGPDLIPFLPFIGIFGGWLIIKIARRVIPFKMLVLGGQSLSVRKLALLSVISVLGIIALYRGSIFRTPGPTLQSQYQEAEKVAALLGPGDRIYVQGPLELLVLPDIPNLNPYIALNSGADDYIGASRPQGFASVIAEMEAQAPKVVAMSRLRNVRHAEELMEWVNQHYDKWDAFTYAPVYIRKTR
jgi:hypothetical protein